MLHGDADDLPELAVLRAVAEAHKPANNPPQHTSSIEQRRPTIETLADAGAAPTAIFDHLRTEHKELGSVTACERARPKTLVTR